MHRERPIDWDSAHRAIRDVAYQNVSSEVDIVFRTVKNDRILPEARENEGPELPCNYGADVAEKPRSRGDGLGGAHRPGHQGIGNQYRRRGIARACGVSFDIPGHTAGSGNPISRSHDSLLLPRPEPTSQSTVSTIYPGRETRPFLLDSRRPFSALCDVAEPVPLRGVPGRQLTTMSSVDQTGEQATQESITLKKVGPDAAGQTTTSICYSPCSLPLTIGSIVC